MEELNKLIRKYSEVLFTRLEHGKKIDFNDVNALAVLIDASANYKMAYRFMESGPNR